MSGTTKAVSRFQMITPLGSGGFGAVYEATDTRTGQHVALKELDDASATSIARFKQEFRALADCHHPNLVSLKELIEHEDRWMIVMELVPGSDLLTFVRGSAENDNQACDASKLHHAFLGMARGLSALHSFGILHRDLKPSNVRVTPEGRAVLLDFGLVTSIDPARQSAYAGALGTVAYMAPEQVTGKSVGAPADWYAFGVCLFEALTGRRPFEAASSFQILADKQQHAAPRASSFAPHVPPELDELCAALLERSPERRAGAEQVFAIFGEGDGGSLEHAQLAKAAPHQVRFTGREPELIQLSRALARTHEGAFKLVLVEGESGVGKSEVVSEFVRRAQQADPKLLALYGRCYENEQVSYKAFDGCIDELARFLRRLPEAELGPLLPPRAALLGQLFPVLRTLPAIAKAPRGETSADPTARRLEAFAALASLLGKLTEERSVLLTIDDLQWADAESFRLLLALAERTDPPSILIVATIRPPEELEPDVARGLEAFRRKQRIDVVQILGLPMQQATALARDLLGPEVRDEYCHKIAEESGGHPLFLSELVHYMQSHDLAARRSLTIEAALRARIERLEPGARELLEIAALAGRPYGAHIFAAALELPSVDESARTLLAAKLLRMRKSHDLGCYHDRIRHTAVSLIARSRLASLHRRLARALSADPNADAIDQARHWDLAGDRDKAALAYEQAAENAFAALAFARAAELCGRALDLLAGVRDERTQRFTERRADALACAGRSAEAAECYERAIEGASGPLRYVLRERHAQQLLVAGKLELGLGLMRSLLVELGVNFPRSQLGWIFQIVLYRIWIALRRPDVQPRAEATGKEHELMTASVLRSFSGAASPVHPIAAFLATMQGVRLAARVPVPETLTMVYAGLGWVAALGGKRWAHWFEKSRHFAKLSDTPEPKANAEFMEGSAHLLVWDFRAAANCLESAHHLVQTQCPDRPWLLRNVRYHLGLAWYAVGEHRRVAEETERWIAEARERNDQLTIGLLAGMGYGFVRHLMRDAPDDALLEFQVAMRELPKEPFSFLHFGEVFATVNALLYKGGPIAHEWLEARASVHKRTLLLRAPIGRAGLAFYSALAALHAYEGRGEKQRKVLIERAHKLARSVEKSESPLMRVYGKLARAQAYALGGESALAVECARAAFAIAPEYADYQKRIALYLIALLETRDERDSRCQGVVQFFRDQGWQNPYAFLRMILPASRQLGERSTQREPSQKLLLGRFEVISPLGGGGFGTVVEARDVQTGRVLALKELVSRHPRSLERFKQEFRALRDLHHANLARLDALFEHEGVWYISMELLRGAQLLAYTRPSGAPDLLRICTVIDELAAGLQTLHDAGFAHRDVTPANVRITGDGRAVLLDFGLIGRLGDPLDEASVGSVEYAAPEQLSGSAPSAAADVYGLGTCLFEALSGKLPFAPETKTRNLERKQPEPAKLHVSQELRPLSVLALEMIAHDPRERPTLAAVRERLRAMAPGHRLTQAPHLQEQQAPFAGREAELDRLSAAFEQTCEQGLKLVLVQGESGLGKSALVAEFARRVAAKYPHALMLRSRCYESEQLAYKAFDGAVDQLARALRELPAPVCEALLPKRAALLGELFPVLHTVPAIAHAPKRGLPADPAARQHAALGCFVELLASLTGRFELLIVIDDLQWADSESFRLLRSLIVARATLPLAIVFTARPSLEVPSEVAGEIDAIVTSECAESLELSGLTHDAAIDLARVLYPSAPPPERLLALVEEAKGHPLFLRELIEQEREGAAHASVTLDDALKARVLSYDPTTRKLLSLVALAGRPYGSHVFARALRLPELPRDAVAGLLARGLLRRSGSDALATYHDRIAHVALELLEPEDRRALARELAEALDVEMSADPALRARLWDQAGELERAARAYEEAADRALSQLQFAHAEQSYARVIELRGDTRDERFRSLVTRRGHALVRAGRSAEASKLYELAAEGAEGEAGARLRLLAAEQAIKSAQISGLTTARELLAELGMAVPTQPKRALTAILWHRMRVGFSLRNMSRSRTPLSAETRLKLDAAWSLAFPLSWLDPLGGAVLGMHHLRLALAAGEPSHAARALAFEAFSRAVYKPNDRTAQALLEQARELASAQGDPALEAEIAYREGVAATFRWDLPRANERLEYALATVHERCPDQPWLTTNIRLALGTNWFNLRQHARLAESMRSWLSEARGRGDEFALSTLSGLGYGFVADLMDDQPQAALEELARHRALWPAKPFSFVQFGDMIADALTRLYQGGELAHDWFERELPRLSRASLLRAGTGKTFYLLCRGVAMLSAYSLGAQAGDRQLLRGARAMGEQLLRIRSSFAVHVGPLILAQVDIAEGHRERALTTLRKARERAAIDQSANQADRTEYLIAALEGAAGRAQRERLVGLHAEQGWRRPRRSLAMFCPVVRLLAEDADDL